ncbi:MAG: hypothetical protein ACM3QW_05005, partial [Ignavibacteriales bacterium]
MERYLKKESIAHLLSLPNVLGLGYGLKETAGKMTTREGIVVMVKTKIPLKQLAKEYVVPKIIDGHITDVVEVGHITARFLQTAATSHLTSETVEIDKSRKSRWRPAPGGVSIGHYKITAGTLGAVVYDRCTGRKLILSNNHVLANSTNGRDHQSKIGDPILQPGPLDGGSIKNDTIGRLYKYVPLRDESFNVVDAALAKPLRRSWIVAYILGVGTVKGITEAGLNMRVKKSGRTTGLTYGRVRAVHVVVDVDYDGRILKFKDQILVTVFDKGGD